MALSFGAIAVTLAVVVLAGLGTFFVANGLQARVIGSTRDLPKELVLCPNFQPAKMFLAEGNSGKHYRIEGECPISAAQAKDPYISDLEYAGWTVHSDDSGNLAGYRYSSREAMAILLAPSSNNSNGTAVAIDMYTSQDVPSDFPPGPSPSASPSASAKPR